MAAVVPVLAATEVMLIEASSATAAAGAAVVLLVGLQQPVTTGGGFAASWVDVDGGCAGAVPVEAHQTTARLASAHCTQYDAIAATARPADHGPGGEP